MFKLITIVAFIAAQLSMPLQAQSQGPAVSEFEKSAQEIEAKIAQEKAHKEKEKRKEVLKTEIRDRKIVLTARVNELETLANEIPNVREDVIEDTARSITTTENKEKRETVFVTSALVAVASGIVYALTKYDVPKAWAGAAATQKPASTATTTAKPQNLRVKASPVNNALRSVYGNKAVARSSATVGVLAAVVAGLALVDSHTWSLDERAAIRSLESNYLSQLVSGGEAQHLTNDQIEDALKRYNKDPEFRAAVINEVKTILAETERLTSEINAREQELAAL